jgi:hypothetical protein
VDNIEILEVDMNRTNTCMKDMDNTAFRQVDINSTEIRGMQSFDISNRKSSYVSEVDMNNRHFSRNKLMTCIHVDMSKVDVSQENMEKKQKSLR